MLCIVFAIHVCYNPHFSASEEKGAHGIGGPTCIYQNHKADLVVFVGF